MLHSQASFYFKVNCEFNLFQRFQRSYPFFWGADSLRRGCTVSCTHLFHCTPFFLSVLLSAVYTCLSVFISSLSLSLMLAFHFQSYILQYPLLHICLSAVPTHHPWHCQCHTRAQNLDCKLYVYLYLAFIMINSLSLSPSPFVSSDFLSSSVHTTPGKARGGIKCSWKQCWLPQSDWQCAHCLQVPRCHSLQNEVRPWCPIRPPWLERCSESGCRSLLAQWLPAFSSLPSPKLSDWQDSGEITGFLIAFVPAQRKKKP